MGQPPHALTGPCQPPSASEVDVDGDAPVEALRALVEHVDRIAEIPGRLRAGSPVRLAGAR
jgi:hypothetical protein